MPEHSVVSFLKPLCTDTSRGRPWTSIISSWRLVACFVRSLSTWKTTTTRVTSHYGGVCSRMVWRSLSSMLKLRNFRWKEPPVMGSLTKDGRMCVFRGVPLDLLEEIFIECMAIISDAPWISSISILKVWLTRSILNYVTALCINILIASRLFYFYCLRPVTMRVLRTLFVSKRFVLYVVSLVSPLIRIRLHVV